MTLQEMNSDDLFLILLISWLFIFILADWAWQGVVITGNKNESEILHRAEVLGRCFDDIRGMTCEIYAW